MMRPILNDSENKIHEINGFKILFNREPKVWTIEMLYTLWQKTKERSSLRQKKRTDCIDEIISKIQPDSPTYIGDKNPNYIVYYKDDNRNENDCDRLYKIHIRYLDDYKSYGVSYRGYVGDSNSIIDNRNDMINSIVDGDLRLELGMKYNKLDRLSNTFLSEIVFNYLWNMIESVLIKKNIKDEIFEINICGDDYFIHTETSTYGRPKYKLVPKTNREKIEFN